MKEKQKFTLLRKILKALGISDDRIEEIIDRIQQWLLDDQLEEQDQKKKAPQYPYHLRDDFLSAAELSFFRVLQVAVADWAIIFAKVSQGDLFYAQTGDYGKNRAYRNKIDRKHIDFLLCDPQTARPILGIELDDKSHQRADRQERDRFVDKVFAAAKLPLVHIPVRYSYPSDKLRRYLQEKAGTAVEEMSADEVESPTEAINSEAQPFCPICGSEMMERSTRSGRNAGNKFWGCSNYPQCRGIVNIELA